MNILHLPEEHRFEVNLEGGTAVLEYQPVGADKVDFYRTYVPPSLRGRGVAEALVKHGLDWARQRQLRIAASCWYVADYLKREQQVS